MQIVECFKILNVSPGEDWNRVRQSYHALARKFHPDINPEKGRAEIRLKEINQAFEILENYYRNSNDLPRYVSIPQKNPPTKWDNLIERFKGHPWVQNKMRSGLHFLVGLDNKVFQLDIKKDIKISGSKFQKGSSLHVKSGKESFEVKVPTGDWSQMSYTIPGKGESSLFSGRRGDLVLNFHMPFRKTAKPKHTRFSYEIKIPREQINRGRVLTLQSSEGPIKFILPRNTHEGQKFTLSSRGRQENKPEILHVLTVRLD